MSWCARRGWSRLDLKDPLTLSVVFERGAVGRGNSAGLEQSTDGSRWYLDQKVLNDLGFEI
jgi:hypothetical protein